MISTPAAGAIRPREAGLASAAATMITKGVRAVGDAPAIDENALGEAWADLGASFGAGADSDALSFSLRSLTDPPLLARAAQLASRQMGQPAWPEDIWQRERARWSAAIRESDTRPGTVAGKAFAKAVYGSHPYGQRATAETLCADRGGRAARLCRSAMCKPAAPGWPSSAPSRARRPRPW
ncbi:MAG: hypothetical protein V9G23_13975 [Giesbergeria sp.]